MRPKKTFGNVSIYLMSNSIYRRRIEMISVEMTMTMTMAIKIEMKEMASKDPKDRPTYRYQRLIKDEMFKPRSSMTMAYDKWDNEVLILNESGNVMLKSKKIRKYKNKMFAYFNDNPRNRGIIRKLDERR